METQARKQMNEQSGRAAWTPSGKETKNMSRLNKDKRKKKLAERERRRAKPELADTVMGSCVDCGEPCYLHQEYVVKDETWAEAGINGCASGRLHIQCLTGWAGS
jgi:hypothetical protein